MSPYRRPLPTLAEIDIPFLEVILAFLQQVLHIPTPERLAVHTFTAESDTPVSAIMRRLITPEYTVTIVFEAALPLIGNTIQFAIEPQGDDYAITGVFFKPGWRQNA